jgi:hypothetical protein
MRRESWLWVLARVILLILLFGSAFWFSCNETEPVLTEVRRDIQYLKDSRTNTCFAVLRLFSGTQAFIIPCSSLDKLAEADLIPLKKDDR